MHKPLQAAALRYDADTDDAPRVVAAGEGHLARLLIERAKTSGVPVLEDAELAGALMRVRLGEQVPSKVYYAVAKVLAFVYALEKRAEAEAEDDPDR